MRLTKAQRTLKRLHGDPDAFTDAVINAIGEISKDEALAAIREYRQRWNAAAFKGSAAIDEGRAE